MIDFKMSPEVLIYVQTVKNFINNNDDAKKHFAIQGNEEKFFQFVGELSQKNFEENGEPELTIFQLEEIRQKIIDIKEKSGEILTGIGIFISIGDLGYISLN